MAQIISVTVIGVDKVMGGITAFQDVMRDLRPFWREVFAPKYFADVQDTFALEGQSRANSGQFGSGHWAPLSRRYAAWKAKAFPGKGILEATGRLRGSLRWQGSGPGPGGFFDAQPTFALAGTRVPYGRHHMTGTSNMPARPFLHSPDPALYAPLLRDWLLREGRSRGGPKAP